MKNVVKCKYFPNIILLTIQSLYLILGTPAEVD